MTAIRYLLSVTVLVTAAVVADAAIKAPPGGDDWRTLPPITIPPKFTFPTFTLPTRPTFPTFTLPTRHTFPTFTFPTKPRPTLPTITLPTATIPPRHCRDIRTRRQCVTTRPCPEGPKFGSFCRWIPIPNRFPLDPIRVPVDPIRFPIDPITPLPLSKRSIKEHHDSIGIKNMNNQKRQASIHDDLVIRPYPRPPFKSGICTCCAVTACDPPMKFNRATCRCKCPKGTRRNARGQCVGDCDNIQDLNLCPSIYCDDNPHFRCKRVGYQCKCPSCDAATERAWCDRTKCLEQPQKLKCVFDTNTYKCRCPRCMDQNGDRPWCLMTYCGPNNSVRCKWEAAWRKCFCPAH